MNGGAQNDILLTIRELLHEHSDRSIFRPYVLYLNMIRTCSVKSYKLKEKRMILREI